MVYGELPQMLRDVLYTIGSDILQILFAPINNKEILWFLIPVYFTWLGSIYFSRDDNDFGDAFASGFLAIWTAINWYVEVGFYSGISTAMTAGIGIFGLIVIIESFLGVRFVKKISGARYVAYFIIVFTPYIYGIIEFQTDVILAMLVMLLFVVILPIIIRLIFPVPE